MIWLTLGIGNGETLSISVDHVVALARLLFAVLTKILDDDTHLVRVSFGLKERLTREERVLRNAVLFDVG